MKRSYFVLLAIFSVLVMLLIPLQLQAELTLEEAKILLNNKIIVLNSFNTVLGVAIGTMGREEKAWEANEEDITENRIDYASADLWGLGGAALKQVMDMEDRREIAVSLGAAIKAVESAKDDADKADTARDLVWVEYVKLADEANISPNERLSKGPDALSVTYPGVSLNCSGCSASWSGSGISGIGDHITSCTVSGHKNLAGELVSAPLPHFTCETCPLLHQHHTFACEGGCGELSRSPTYLSPPPSSQGAGNMVKIYYDHRRDPCGKKTGTLTTCSSQAFTCQSPECPNDANHLIDGECGVHEVKKGDTSAVSAHSKLPTSHSQQGRCPVTHDFDGETYQCVLINTYYCDLHDFHDFVDGVGTYPIIEPEEPTNPPSSPSYHACGVHETSVSGDHSLQASCSASNANGSCTVSGFYACDGHSHVYPSPPTVVCPANRWTSCGGTVSHETTCGAGHTYYTCNPSAVSWHQTPRTCSRSGCNSTYTNCSRGSDTKHCLGKYKWHK